MAGTQQDEKENDKKAREIIVFLAIILPLVCIFFISSVQAGTETLISTNASASNQIFPGISGNWIFWTDTRNDDGSGSSDIYAYNVVTGSERRITPPGSYANHPAVSGDFIVWEDLRNLADFDIYAYDLGSDTETRITNDPGNQQYPAVDGNLVVWQDDRNGDYNIYLSDLSGGTEQLLTPDTVGTDQTSPAIAGNHVVWQDYRNGATGDIYLNNTATADLFNLNPGTAGVDHLLPAMSGSRVVWQDSRHGPNEDIYLNDTASWAESRVNDVVPGSAKVFPSISGNTVVWIDTRNPGFNDVYLRDLTGGADTRITNDLALLSTVDGGPKISGNRIVWTDLRNGDNDIFLYTTGPDQTCPAADFTISPTRSGPLPFTVQFTDTSSAGTTGISHWNWEFGDGNTSDQQNPNFTYTIPGNYHVRLTINNAYCRNETPVSNSYLISVGAAPVSSFTTDTTSGMVPLTVTFNDTSVAATTWNWSFGDGTYSDLQSPSHTYSNGGTYTVLLNASNVYGYSHAQTTIHALTGANENADTVIDGIAITTPFGAQFLTYDMTKLPGPVNTGTTLICTSPQLLSHGWQNITFLSRDGIGFVPEGTLIKGNISGVTFLTREINPAGFSAPTGPLDSINYSITLPSYPNGAMLNTQIWEGFLPADYTLFNNIAHLSGFSEIWGIAYTTKITKTNIPNGGTAKFHMSVNATWVENFNGRNHIYVERISDDRTVGEVLQSRFISHDAVKNLDYFEIDSPHGFSTFGLSSLSGSGNLFQLFTLTVTSHVNPPQEDNLPSTSDSDSNPAGGKGAGKITVPVYTPSPTSTPIPKATEDPGTSAKVYTNANGVVTQATRLQSTDGRATVSLDEGVVAKDASGKPLAEITLKSLPSENLPALPSGSAFTFAGMAYEIGPDGATFSPPVSLSFTLPQAQWGQDYTVKFFDQKSGTWQDLPTAFDAATGTVTARFSHLCIFALFAEPRASLVTTPAATPLLPVPEAPQVKAQPPATAMSIFMNMMAQLPDLVMNNAVVLAIVALLGIAAYIIRQGKFPG